MDSWEVCFKLEKGKTYRFRYVYLGDDTVKESVLTWQGDMTWGNPTLITQPDDRATVPGRIQILQIDEQEAPADILGRGLR